MLFGMLGISSYGNREIAKCRENKKILSNKFWSIYLIQFICSVVMTIIYFIYTIFFSEYKTVSYIQFFLMLSALFDINWFFFGLEDFRITVSRNMIIKIVSFFLIVFLVLNEDDLWKYALIVSLSTFFSQLILWLFLFKRVNYVKIRRKDALKHFKKILIFFIPVISYSIYKIMDKIMIGLLSEVEAVAFYENAEKISNVPIAIIAALGMVMLPRVSNLAAKNKDKEVRKYMDKSFRLVLFIIAPLVVLFIVYGCDLCTIYLGSEFEKSGFLLQLLSVTILFVSVANVIRTQFLIPYSRDKEYVLSTVIGAVLNFILNLIFIPQFGAVGACVGTIAAECSVMLYQIIVTRRDLDYAYLMKQIIFFFLLSIVSVLVAMALPLSIDNNVLALFVHCFVCIIVYLMLNLKYFVLLLRAKDF